MRQKLVKNRRLQKQIRRRSKLVKQIIKDTEHKKKHGTHGGCYREAEERFEAWAGKLL